MINTLQDNSENPFLIALRQLQAETKPAEAVEFRLYYDKEGAVVCYTMEQLPGDYIVISKEQYAAGDYTLRVIDGKIVTLKQAVAHKLIPSEFMGTGPSTINNVMIVYDPGTTKWILKAYD